MFRNMATSLILKEKINTTLPKAKELRGIVERFITLGKRGDLHSRRLAASYLFDDEAVKKVEKLGGKKIFEKTAVPGHGYFICCQDTEGNSFALWEKDEGAK